MPLNTNSMAKKASTDPSTEEKIKEAARKVFTRKGYAATRTRDIAEEAGINLALLNYYFRSKEKLFEIVMLEKFQKFFGIILNILISETTNLEEKIELIAQSYIDTLSSNPDLPIFVLSEIRNNPERFASNVHLKKVLADSCFVKQLHATRPDLNPLQLIMSLLGLTIFPFLMKPILLASKNADQKGFDALMNERKVLIPKWANAMLKSR